MHATLLSVLLFSLQGGLLGAGNPCSPGVKVADQCFEISHQGCCTNDKAVRWCQDGVLCELSCASKPACGWKAGAGVYDCAAVPKGDPSCNNPYSCLVDGCAPAYEQKGCCGCPCEDCVCSKDPYCCQVSWDPVCVQLCTECGGCGSTDGCTPAPTPGCNGCKCQECVCEKDPWCCTGKWDSLCALMCAEDCAGGCQICEPDCSGKACGSDGCGGLCGICPSGQECEDGHCQKICVPSCSGRECGMDTCGVKSCGTCDADHTCNKFNKCVPKPCEPDCDGRECGDDGCGGTCGECDEGVPCVAGACVPGACMPQCDNKQCGEDGCGGWCGWCDPGFICDDTAADGDPISFKCEIYCKPSCTGKTCGDDGCGGSCGECLPGQACTELDEGGRACKAPCFPICDGKQCGPDHCGGTCGECAGDTPACSAALGYMCVAQEQCIPDCLGKECGGDGCGGTCGQCPSGWQCSQGMCATQCTPQCFVPPTYMAAKQCGWNECPGEDVCGVCPEGFACAPGYICLEETCSCAGKQCGVPEIGCPPCGECQEGDVCDTETFQCIPCQPECQTEGGLIKQCGADGCGGVCGECQAPEFKCDEVGPEIDGDEASFSCEPCVPSCLNNQGQVKQCGDDGCGGSCGSCPPSLPSCLDDNNEGQCVACIGQCELPPVNPVDPATPMQCGPNNCPPGCLDVGLKPCEKADDCDPGQQCNAMTGMCVACGSCGNCPIGQVCDVSFDDDPEIYVCQPCQPDCTGKECGSNGCGGVCGVCPPSHPVCNEEGQCEEQCDPGAGCFGKECGPYACPSACMTDPDAEECGPYGQCPEGLHCDPNQNLCVDCASCGDCGEGQYCAAGYLCQPIPEACAGKECGDDGQGGSCGECDEAMVCEDGMCVEESTGPDVVEQPDVTDEPDEFTPDEDTTTSKPDNKVQPDTGGNCPTSCPPGYRVFFCKCVPDEEEVAPKKDGCSAAVGPVAPAQTGTLLLALLFAAGLLAIRRRRT